MQARKDSLFQAEWMFGIRITLLAYNKQTMGDYIECFPICAGWKGSTYINQGIIYVTITNWLSCRLICSTSLASWYNFLLTLPNIGFPTPTKQDGNKQMDLRHMHPVTISHWW